MSANFLISLIDEAEIVWHTWHREASKVHRTKERLCRQWPRLDRYVAPSKTGRTLYFNGRGLMKLKGQRRGESGGNYVDMETGESFWISGVKKNGEDRHWAGSGKILFEAAALSDYLKAIGARTLDRSRYEVTDAIRQTDVKRISQLANSLGEGWPESKGST